MAKIMKAILHNFKREKEGSFTIEAALIFPTIFILILGMLFFSLFIHLNVYTYYKASLAAERAAFSWNNSYRSPVTGEINMNYIRTQNDGLYWRIPDVLGSGRLQETKMNQALASVKFNGDSQAAYKNKIFRREVNISMSQKVTAPVLIKGMYGEDGKAAGQAFALVTDPVDYIRSFDLLYYYLPGVIKDVNGNGKVKSVFESFTSD